MTKTHLGWGLIVLALIVAANRTADEVIELKTWHGLLEPNVVGLFVKEVTGYLIAGLGGALLPSPTIGAKGE